MRVEKKKKQDAFNFVHEKFEFGKLYRWRVLKGGETVEKNISKIQCKRWSEPVSDSSRFYFP